MTDDQSARKSVTDQISDRRLRRWNTTAEAVARIFDEFSDTTRDFTEIHKLVIEMHKKISEHGKTYKTSEEAVESVLKRFVKTRWLTVRRQRFGRFIRSYYSVTYLGRQIFARAREYFEKRPQHASLIQAGLGRVPRPTDKEDIKRMEFEFRPWGEIVAWKEGWPEQRVLPTIRYPPYIIRQLRLMATRAQGKTNAGWVWVDGAEFKMRIASAQAVQLYVGESKWKDELKEWLTTVPNLRDDELDLIWMKIAAACKHQRVTWEFHVPDSRIAIVRPDCAVEIDLNNGAAPLSMKFVYSCRPRQAAEIHFTGEEEYVERVCVNLAAQFAAGAYFENTFAKKLAEHKKEVEKRFTNKLDHTQRELKILRFTVEKLYDEVKRLSAEVNHMKNESSQKKKKKKEDAKDDNIPPGTI